MKHMNRCFAVNPRETGGPAGAPVPPGRLGGVGSVSTRRAAGLHWLLAATLSLAAVGTAAPALVELANPLQGTDSIVEFSGGNTYPAIALPFPMNVWAPYTQPSRDPFYYQYRQPRLRGLRQTHQPSPWIGEYAAFALMPVSGKLALKEDDRASEFRHEGEIAQPSYYRVRLDTWKTVAEVTPTERGARFRFTFESPNEAYVVLDAFPGGSSVEILPAERTILGTCRNNRGGVPNNFTNYFVLVFDQPFAAHGVWSPEAVQSGAAQLAGGHVGAYVRFNLRAGGMVGCKVASSFIGPEQARRNLQREIGDATFDTVRQQAEQRWNEALGRACVEGGTETERRTFYSALYRSVLFPHKFYELDAQERPVYFSPYDGQIHAGYLYTDSGFWDTFRAAHPLYNLLFPEVSAEILQGLLAAYEQSGWLPSWSSPGHRECMIGNHAFSLLADAWVKGVRGFDAQKAVTAMSHDANSEGPVRSIGRDGVKAYNSLGYVPSPDVREATAKTLEYAYNDYCAATLARAVGREAEAKDFERRSANWRNVFDPQTGFVRGRKADGKWCEPFHPDEWGGPFTEGCPWHWNWSVFHDTQGLIQALGGDAAFVAKIDELFAVPPTVRVGSYGGLIHEMTEMIALQMGQYAHGNQPIQHLIYLYDYAGQPWKTQARIREAMTKLYAPTPRGLCGDEDNGQTSAWYVFSALGFYPVTPGHPTYAVGSPLFARATLTLPGGKKFVVHAPGNAPERVYLQSARLNGKPFDRAFLTHEEVVGGGELRFKMSAAPNRGWAVGPQARPFSLTPPGR
jgi:predicted alpha-1,2-mannosidase